MLIRFDLRYHLFLRVLQEDGASTIKDISTIVVPEINPFDFESQKDAASVNRKPFKFSEKKLQLHSKNSLNLQMIVSSQLPYLLTVFVLVMTKF